MKMSDLKTGMYVQLDDGFTCMKSGLHLVKHSEAGFFVTCEEGEHMLDGQEDENGELVGVSSALIKTN